MEAGKSFWIWRNPLGLPDNVRIAVAVFFSVPQLKSAVGGSLFPVSSSGNTELRTGNRKLWLILVDLSGVFT